MSKTVLEFALEYIRAGYSVIPIKRDGTKAPPCAWKEYQTTPTSEEQARIWWGPEAVLSSEPLGIAAVCGFVSHSLHLLDFDVEPIQTYGDFEAIVAEEQPGLMERLCVVKTPSGGFHLWMRCSAVTIPGNQKLANVSPSEARSERIAAEFEGRKARTCLVETRGTGGYALVAGSPGACHPTGREYDVRLGSMLTLADITAEQHEFLIGLARRFDRGCPDPEPIPVVPGADLKPGEDLDRSSFPWSRILEPAGWKLCSGHEGSEMRWKRPGKKEGGHSATTGRCFSNGCDLLRVFSSEAAPFDTKPYGKFRAMTLLHFGGDFSACAKHLHQQNFGSAPSGGRAHAPASTGGGGANNASTIADAGLDNMLDLEPVLKPMHEVDPTQVRWLWYRWLPFQMLSIIDGDPGTGKSQLCLDLAARISTGRNMPPYDGRDASVTPGGVLLMSAEDVLSCTVRPRLDAAGADCSRIFSFTGVLRGLGKDRTERPPVLPQDLELITPEIVRRHQIRLIIVDPVMAYLDSAYSSYKDQDIRRAFAPLAQMAERLNISILFVRHLNKMSGGPALYRGGSSIAIIGAVRSGLLVGRHPEEENVRVLASNKMQLTALPPSLKYEIVTAGTDTSRIKWLGEAEGLYADDILGPAAKKMGEPGMGRPPKARNDASTFLMDLLAGGKKVNSLEVFRRGNQAGFSPATLNRAKKDLGIMSDREGEARIWRMPSEDVKIADEPEPGPEQGDLPYQMSEPTLSNVPYQNTSDKVDNVDLKPFVPETSDE